MSDGVMNRTLNMIMEIEQGTRNKKQKFKKRSILFRHGQMVNAKPETLKRINNF